MRGRAKRDGFVRRRSLHQCRANPRDRQFRRADHEFVGQTQNAKSLAAKPGVARGVGRLLFLAIMARPVDFNNEAALEANEIDEEGSQRDLPLKFLPFAPPIANRAPNQRLGLNGVRTLFARETTHDRAGDFLLHRANINRRANVASRRASRDPPHPTLADARATFPREGGRGSRVQSG